MAIGCWMSGLATAVSLVACHDPTGPPKLITALPRPLTAAEQRVIEGSNEFAFALLREVNQLWADSNVFISPLSASMALGMTLNGARGETFDAMRLTLGFPELPLEEIDASYRRAALRNHPVRREDHGAAGELRRARQRLPVACRRGDSLPPIG